MDCVYIPRLRFAKNALLVLFLFCLKLASAQVGLSSSELELFNLLNQERAKAGLPKFQWNYQLAESARAHTQLLAKHEDLSHQFPGEAILGDRIGAVGLRFDVAAENVAAGSSVQDVHSGLMESPQHRANILSPKYNSIGLAIIPSKGDLYVTEDFAHTLPSYTEEQFRQAVVAAFNKQRQANGAASVSASVNPHLHELACSESNDAQHMIEGLPGSLTLVIFTSSSPEKLPPSMEKAAMDKSFHRMDIGVCFKPEKEHGYGSFRILAAFYP